MRPTLLVTILYYYYKCPINHDFTLLLKLQWPLLCVCVVIHIKIQLQIPATPEPKGTKSAKSVGA